MLVSCARNSGQEAPAPSVRCKARKAKEWQSHFELFATQQMAGADKHPGRNFWHRTLGLHHLTAWDRAASRQCNRINHHRTGDAFAVVSRLGDGWVWFALMALLPVIYGNQALVVSLVMLATGAIATALYKVIKHSTHRLRPCESTPDLILTVAPLDRFSFPSGHTLHAVCFTIIACSAYPGWMWLLVPFTVLVGLSRLVLGLHYLSDVLVGAIIGGTLGVSAVLLFSVLGFSAWT